MKPYALFIILLCTISAVAQNHYITYQESIEDFSNPERGFYLPFTTSTENFTPLDKVALVKFQSEPQQAKSATYTFHGSLIYRAYVLVRFKTAPIDTAFLQ